MFSHPTITRPSAVRGPGVTAVAALAVLLGVALGASRASAGKRGPFAARAGLEFAEAAARVWAQDASLVYLENDDDVGASGVAPCWGYLFYSPGRNQARAYSVGDGRIVAAEDPGMKFDAPPVAAQWIDSEAALAAADEHGGREYCRAHAGRVGTMLLTRGTFESGTPDLTTWTVVYTSPAAPSLFVVVDAAQGRFCRTWRG